MRIAASVLLHWMSPSGAARHLPRKRRRPRLSKGGDRLDRNSFQQRHLVVSGLVDDEFVDPSLPVAADDVVERIEGAPGVVLGARGPQVQRTHDLLGIAAHLRAFLVQHLVSRADLIDRAERIPAVGVLSTEPQHPRAVGADGQWRPGLLNRPRPEFRMAKRIMLALESDDLTTQKTVHDLDRFLEPADQLAGTREIDAIHGVLGFIPTRPQAELEPAVGDVVDGDGLLGEKCRVSKGIARDQHADPDPARDRCKAGEQGPALEVGPVRTAGLGIVVAIPNALEAKLLVQLPALNERRPRQVLVRADPESNGSAETSRVYRIAPFTVPTMRATVGIASSSITCAAGNGTCG